MLAHLQKRKITRERRLLRVRKALKGNAVRPRLSIGKSNKHICVQLIDDDSGMTIASASTLSTENKSGAFNKKSKEAARLIGKQIAEKAKAKNVQKIIFDRGRHRYHGVIAELAQSARENGLEF